MSKFKENFLNFKKDFFRSANLCIYLLIGYSIKRDVIQSRYRTVLLPIFHLFIVIYGIISGFLFTIKNSHDIAIASTGLCPCLSTLVSGFRVVYLLKYKIMLKDFKYKILDWKENTSNQRYQHIYSDMSKFNNLLTYSVIAFTCTTAISYCLLPFGEAAYEMIRYGNTTRKLPVDTV